MGSKTFDGVHFIAYTDDHLPPHVHAFYSETTVILELDFSKREIRLASRKDTIRPKNAKKSDISRIRRAAEEYGNEIFALWEAARG